jgi:enoyl-CoA hydratase/carnithine racemase
VGYSREVTYHDEKEAAIYDVFGPIALITMNRPQGANALNTAMHRDVVPYYDIINADPNIKVAIITAVGDRFFCAGRDVKEYVETYGGGEKKIRPIDDPNSPMFGKLCNHYIVNKPLIGAINGAAVGGGLEIVLMTDLRVMADHTYIADLHAKVNVGGMNSLASELPWPIANYLTMANGRLSAQEAAHFGFVNRVVPKEKLIDTAFELADMVMTSGPDSLRRLKEGSIRRQISSGNIADPATAGERRNRMAGMAAAREADSDLLEGMRAFVEKRDVSYQKPT